MRFSPRDLLDGIGAVRGVFFRPLFWFRSERVPKVMVHVIIPSKESYGFVVNVVVRGR